MKITNEGRLRHSRTVGGCGSGLAGRAAAIAKYLTHHNTQHCKQLLLVVSLHSCFTAAACLYASIVSSLNVLFNYTVPILSCSMENIDKTSQFNRIQVFRISEGREWVA